MTRPTDTIFLDAPDAPRQRRKRRFAADVGILLSVAESTNQSRLYREIREDEFQAWVYVAARDRGWVVFATRRSRTTPEGEPDLRMISPPNSKGVRKYLVVELKTERGKLSPAQEETLRMLDECPGVEWAVWRPSQWESILKELEKWL